MKGKNLLTSLGYIDLKFVEESEKDIVSNTVSSKSKRTCAKRPLLIAAMIALLLMLVGCAAIYHFSMQDLKIGEHTAIYTEQAPAETTEWKLEVLSLQGVKDSPNYLANQEWLAFTQSYQFPGGEYWESDPAYWAYSVQDQAMVDKLNEICRKYELKVIGKPWHEEIDCHQFLPLLGIDTLLKPDTEATLSIPSGRYFPGGSFTIYGTLNLGEASVPFTYHCVKKDVFYDVFGYVDPNAVTQRNYTTADGVSLLLLESKGNGMLLADRADCFLSLGVTLTGDASLEEIAECFDFTIQPTPPYPAAADAREQESIEKAHSMQDDPNRFSRPTYAEYVEDLIQGGMSPSTEYAFYDLDGNGIEELLIFYDGKIGSVVGMKNGRTEDGKSYCMTLCEGNILINEQDYGHPWKKYHIFRFANDGDPVFSNPKEESIVRLKEENGSWWRTSSTDHYAECDTPITEAEAKKILNSYTPVALDSKPLTEFEEPASPPTSHE